MRNFIVVDVPQRSEAWFQSRAGKATASRAADIVAKIKSGEAAARRNYRVQLVAERLTGRPQEDGFVSPAMVRGIELEDAALAAYEALTGEMPSRVGFLQHVELPIGSSPDGVIGDYEGILELKVPNPATHIGYLKGGTLPADYLPQVTHHLFVSGAAYVDFMSYGPNFPDALQTFLVRVYRSEVDLDSYEAALRLFLKEVENEVLTLRTMVNPVAQMKAALA